MKKEALLILDFGSQYTHLINTKLMDISFNSVVEAGDFKVNELVKKYPEIKIKGIILSGGSQSVYNSSIKFDKKWFELNLPILGICYGHQLLAEKLGGKVYKTKPEYGYEKIIIKEKGSIILSGVKNGTTIWMSHGDTVVSLPEDFRTIAQTKDSPNTIIENTKKQYYGIQFHPEVSHTEQGLQILDNFASKICKIEKTKKWQSKTFIKESIKKYRKIIGNNKLIFGISGGVDSMTMAVLLTKILPKKQLLAVYIDNGLMPEKTKDEVKNFCKSYEISLIIKNSSNSFFEHLKNASTPIKKGKIIGRLFIREFEKIAKQENIKFFAQGTIYSDVIESGITKYSSQIKPHHNVGCLPKKMHIILIEPLRFLFKDKVRELARYMKLPEDCVNKKVFPGPGFAIRVEGKVTRKKIFLVRKCTKIIEDVMFDSKISNDIWMAFAILINVPSLGVKGDKKVKNKQAIVVRIVESKNSMTANFSQKAFLYLAEISNRIIKETSIGRIVYDITNKPPATIEWQ